MSVHLKKTSKLVNLGAAILILKMEKDTQHFQHTMFYYVKKDKNTTEMKIKKTCAVYGEGDVIIDCVKNGL